MGIKEVKERVDFLLSITHATESGAMAQDFLGFNQPDYLYFRDAEIEEGILPDALYKLKKYKEQLDSQGLWGEDLDLAQKPSSAGFKKRKAKPIDGAKVTQSGSSIEISEIKGHIWDLINALKAYGGRARKVGAEFIWTIESKSLFENRAAFEAVGLDFTGLREKPASEEVQTAQAFRISKKRVKFYFHFPYNVELVNFFRSQEAFEYNKADHSRSVILNNETALSVKLLIDKVQSLKLPIVGLDLLSDLDAKVKESIQAKVDLEKHRQDLNATKTNFEADVPGLDSLKMVPFGYQKAGIAFLNKSGGRGILGDEMGLGKTLQALAWVVTNKKKAIVVCPKSFTFGWKEEIEKFSFASAQVLTSKKTDLVGADFTIVNYESVGKHNFTDFDTLIIDESHLVKNRKTARYLEVEALAERASHVICLSGTAIVNRPLEFYTQLNLVKPGLVGSYSKYTKKFCGAFHDGYAWNVKGASNIDELVELISPVYIRRNKKDVLKELPDKIRQEIVVQGVEVGEPENQSSEGILAWVTKTKVHLAKAKIEATIEFAKNMVEQGDKVIIFSDYVEPVVRIAEAFGEEAICYLAELSPEERSQAQKQFQNDPTKKVFVATSKIASVALTLTAASKVIFNDLPWTPGTLMQAEDRAHRVGQKNTVNVYRMVARGTLDDQVTALLTSKAEILKAVLEGKGLRATELDGPSEKSILTDIIDVFRLQKSKQKIKPSIAAG